MIFSLAHSNIPPSFLSCVQDYIFSLLTGYFDPPEGTPELGEGMAYNPYFPGGAIAMPQQLFPDGVEYDDGKREATLKFNDGRGCVLIYGLL